MTETSYKNLGEILLEMGALSRDALNQAVQLQSRRLGQVLIDERLADASLVAQALKLQATLDQAPMHQRVTLTMEKILNWHQQINKLFPQLATQPAIRNQLNYLAQQLEDQILTSVKILAEHWKALITQANESRNEAIQFELDIEDLTINPLIVHELKDIGVHLIRNAIAHGVFEQGLPQIQAQIRFSNGYIELSIADNGGGIRKDKVLNVAKSKGLVPESVSDLSDSELRNLIFTPGFSTKSTADHDAGRGIGLDVVEAAVLRWGGDVQLSSKAGQGVTFSVRLPFLHGRFSVICMKSGEQWIAFPVKTVQTVLDGKGKDENTKSVYQGAAAAPDHQFVVQDYSGQKWSAQDLVGPTELFFQSTDSFVHRNYGITGYATLPDPFAKVLLTEPGLLRVTGDITI